MRIFPKGQVLAGNDAIVLDHPPRNGEPVILSHAHADHAVKRGRIIASPETSRLLKVRYDVNSEGIEYGTPRDFGKIQATLYPSGHILGSAQVLVKSNKTSLLYSGDIKLRQGYSCRPIQVPQAENLIIEATFGTHVYQWPARDKIERQVFDFIERTRNDGATPVFLAYSLGKSQELMALLATRDIEVRVSHTVWEMCQVYEEFGIKLGNYRPYDDEEDGDTHSVLIIPSQKARFLSLTNARFATVSGWAVTRRFNRGAIQIPLSDHADFGELLRYVDRVKPRRVYTTHGYARELATTLRHRGYDARPLKEVASGMQLSLT